MYHLNVYVIFCLQQLCNMFQSINVMFLFLTNRLELCFHEFYRTIRRNSGTCQRCIEYRNRLQQTVFHCQELLDWPRRFYVLRLNRPIWKQIHINLNAKHSFHFLLNVQIMFICDKYLLMSRPRADASKFLHAEPRSNAFFAALTAKSISALSPSATSASVLPVWGLSVANFLPDRESTNSLLMKS